MTLAADTWDALPAYVRAADEAGGLILRTWLGALPDQVQPSIDWLTSGAALNPGTCPPVMVPFVAALAGVDLTGIPVANWRAFIASGSRARGSVAAVAARVAMTLTGAAQVTITNPSLNTIAVRTMAGDTPDTTATAAAARAELPAWVVLDFATVGGIDYATLTSRYSTYSALAATGYTYAQLSALT